MANYSLNLKNLPLNVSEDTLRQFYSKIGRIRDIRIVTNKATAPNFFAFAFVDFATTESCSRALSIDPSPLGPCVEAKFATKRGTRAAKNSEPELPAPLEVADARSVVVTCTSPRITEAMFAKFFAQFGKVESVRMTHKELEYRAFVRFTEDRFAKAAVSQRDRVIDDDVLIFIRPASEARLPFYWHSNVMARMHSYFNSEELDEGIFEDLYNTSTKKKAEQEALKAKQEEEEYQPGDEDASRRCRRVFVALESDDDESDGAEADDEALNLEEQEDSQKLEEYFSKFQLQSLEEETEDNDEWPTCDSAEGQRIQSLVCPMRADSPDRPPRYATRVISPPASDMSEGNVSALSPGLFSWSRGESSSRSESGPSPDLSESSQADKPRSSVGGTPPESGPSYFKRLLEYAKSNESRCSSSPARETNQDRLHSFPKVSPGAQPVGLSRGRGLEGGALAAAAPGSANLAPVALGRGRGRAQLSVMPLGGLGRGRRS